MFCLNDVGRSPNAQRWTIANGMATLQPSIDNISFVALYKVRCMNYFIVPNGSVSIRA